MSVFGSMRPLLHDAKGVRFQSRLAVLTKQGIVNALEPRLEKPRCSALAACRSDP